VMAREPIDILANPTFLPACIEEQYDALWTSERMEQVIAAAVRYGVAIEINARYRIPSPAFLRLAKDAGVRFSFGSNQHGEDIGRLGYCLEMAHALGLTRQDIFTPRPPGSKPIQTRSFADAPGPR
jgi:histidinol phosphatase-like PHP family hydrolase